MHRLLIEDAEQRMFSLEALGHDMSKGLQAGRCVARRLLAARLTAMSYTTKLLYLRSLGSFLNKALCDLVYVNSELVVICFCRLLCFLFFVVLSTHS